MNKLTQALRCTVLTGVIAVLCGCANMTPQQKNTTVGASVGAVAGAVLTGGSPVGTVGGAVVGGVIGNQVKR